MTSDHPTSAGAQRSGFPVLVVDDNASDLAMTFAYLRAAWPFDHDLEVEFARDGAEALQKVHDKRFALLVLDWRLPKMGDGEVLRQLRAEGVRLPTVVVSGLARHEITADLESLGASFVHKDQLSPSTLYRAIALSLQLLGFPMHSQGKS